MLEPSSDLSAELIHAEVAGRLRAAGCVYAEDEATLLVAEATGPIHLQDMVARRVAGIPLEHIVGWAEFCGLRIAVDATVFVPRRRTEFLVQLAIELLRPGGLLVDLCCGSAAIGVAVTAAVDAVDLHAVDIEPAAVRCAQRNVTNGHVYRGDLFEALPRVVRGRVDVITANVPYVPSADIALLPPEARRHEPRLALDGGADGLDTLRAMAAEAADWLTPGGHLLTEVGRHQADEAARILLAGGLDPRLHHCAELDATVAVAVKPLPADPG
jgi:release factor glutamine methyltransferase